VTQQQSGARSARAPRDDKYLHIPVTVNTAGARPLGAGSQQYNFRTHSLTHRRCGAASFETEGGHNFLDYEMKRT
jgi:hypothetical protein